MLTELCKELNNWFCAKKYFGTFTIENGVLDFSELQEGQYFRIVGSVFNDGVYKYPITIPQGGVSELKDETFKGAIWAMAVPKEVIALSTKIKDWVTKYGSVDTMSPYQSESFGGYSYTKASGGNSADDADNPSTWQGAFKSELDNWRKVVPW